MRHFRIPLSTNHRTPSPPSPRRIFFDWVLLCSSDERQPQKTAPLHFQVHTSLFLCGRIALPHSLLVVVRLLLVLLVVVILLIATLIATLLSFWLIL